jgi:hypothetical protein
VRFADGRLEPLLESVMPLDRSLQTEHGQSHNGVTGKARDPSKRQRKRGRRALLMVGAAESAP